MMIMKHVNLTVQGDREVRQGQSEQGRRSRMHHSRTLRNTSQRKLQAVPKHPRTDAVVQQGQADGMAIRREQLPRTSRTRQPRSRASARGHQCKWLNSCRRKSTHRKAPLTTRDRYGWFSSAADGAAAVPAAGPTAAVQNNIR